MNNFQEMKSIDEVQLSNYYKFEELARYLKSLNYIQQTDVKNCDSAFDMRIKMKNFNNNIENFANELKKLVNSTNNVLSYYIEQKENEENESN